MPDKIEEAARYLSAVVDKEPIGRFEDEAREVVASPAVRMAVTEFWCAFWREVCKKYGERKNPA